MHNHADDFKSLGLIIASSFTILYILKTSTKYTSNTYYSRCIESWRNFKEQEELGNLEQLLEIKTLQAKLVESNGQEIPIPKSAHQALRQVIHIIRSGQAVSVIPEKSEMTVPEASELLNVPRAFLLKLLKEGKIPSVEEGAYRRIRRQDLMTYKKQRDIKRSELLDELIQMSQDEGFYEDKNSCVFCSSRFLYHLLYAST